MNKLFVLFVCLITALTGMVCPEYCGAEAVQNDTVGEVQSLVDGIIAYKLQETGAADVQAWIDGALSQEAGATAEWYVFALSQSGDYDFSAYQAALSEYLSGTTVRSATTRQKYALMLAATGSADGYIATTMEESIGQQGIMSWVYGLHLMNNGYECAAVSAESAVDMLLSLQLADGGWALSGEVSDTDVTAMTLQALAAWTDEPRVAAAAERGVARLSELQRDAGDFASYGVPNAESTAQVLTALSVLGIDGLTDARFIKNGCTLLDGLRLYMLPDGSFYRVQNGGYNHMATAQTFYSLIAYQRMLDGRPGIYILDHCVPIADAEEAGAPEQPAVEAGPGYKPVAAAIIAGCAVLACVVLIVLKKRNVKNFVAAAMIAGILIAIVFVTDFQSADSYYSGRIAPKENAIGEVTLTIRCDTVADAGAEHIPDDGVILDVTAFEIAGGDTVYTILTEAARVHGIQLESSGAQGMEYIAGINYLYEFDFGDLSGWVYLVNGDSPSVGCDQYVLEDGDQIQWRYTLELGRDLE